MVKSSIPKYPSIHDLTTSLLDAAKDMLATADFNRSWTDGRRIGNPPEAQLVRIEIAEKYEAWANTIIGMCTLRPIEEYHEDLGNVLWWTYPICEPPYYGSPNSSDWPEYHTHFSLLPPCSDFVLAEVRS